ncbi:MAG TPA: UBP-type zinc finger domain-containing protein [Devosia sp.]
MRTVSCEHAGDIRDVTPSSPDACETCVALGDTWVHLRVCLVCGHVGCCDNSKNRHARAHFHETGHTVIQSYEPGEDWRYCYADDTMLPPGRPFR